MGVNLSKHPSSPMPAVSSPSVGWTEDKGTPRNGIAAEAAGAAWRDGHRGSFHSAASDGESVDAPLGSMGEQLVYVQQLRERMSKEQIEMRSLVRCVLMACVMFLIEVRLLCESFAMLSIRYWLPVQDLACAYKRERELTLHEVRTKDCRPGGLMPRQPQPYTAAALISWLSLFVCVILSASWRRLERPRMHRLLSRLNWKSSWNQPYWPRSVCRN